MIEIAESAVPSAPLRRMVGCMSGQARRTRTCPDTPRLDGKLVVVTGATGGIGTEIARGLARRGADLVLPCRNPAKAEKLRAALQAEPGANGSIRTVALDLEDLHSVRDGARAVAGEANGRGIDVLVENAGIWAHRYGKTRQGHEISFGVNVLAHFLLRSELREAGVLDGARVVTLTGDIYVFERECTPDFTWRGPRGGMRAYCRSKLGNLWMVGELSRRYPDLTAFAVHPGVVATSLGGEGGAIGRSIRSRVLIDPEAGAQTALICATQDGLTRGGYYHNTWGLVRLPDSDAGRDAAAAGRLWDVCESLCRP